MSERNLQTQIDAAKAYEALFVEALFAQFASKVADAAHIERGQRVLDVACGTGILTRELIRRTGSAASLAGIDPSPGMLVVAKEQAPDVEWREGVAESLPFPDRSFDAVVSQFGLMFFTDRKQALREMVRVLNPGGRLAVAVWGSLDSMPAYADLVALLDRTAGRAAADALRAPFVLGDRKALSALFSESGVASPQVAMLDGVARFPSIRILVEADLRGWLPLVGITLAEDRIDQILQEAEVALGSYVNPDGRVTFALSAQLVTATKR